MLAACEAEITPVAVVDERQLELNLKAMATHAANSGKRLRPHAKTHKSVFVARRQLALGAVGLTVATLREAELFAAAGVDDILVAHPPVGAPKLRRVAALASRVMRLAVAVDDVEVGSSMPLTVELLWEVDSGLHRMGTAPGEPTCAAVLELAARVGSRRIRGLLTHGGHAYRVAGATELAGAARQEAEALLSSARELRQGGFSCRVLSVGSTPTAEAAGRAEGITELRPGTYVYNDATQVALGSARLEEVALGVVATVISARPDRAVIDAGSKALSTDLRVAGSESMGMVLGHPELCLERLSEEHGVMTGEGVSELSVGDRLVVIPNHACTTVNLHSELFFCNHGEPHWEPVGARGWREKVDD